MEEFIPQQIGGDIVVYTSKAHTFGTDAVLLAEFARPGGRDLACDLGTGCGIIPLYWAKKGVPMTAYGLDVQEQAIRQFQQSVRDSRTGDRLRPLWGDLKELPKELPRGKFSLVTCNPPYQTGKGIQPEDAAGRIARHEVLCTMADVCRAAHLLLKFGGRFCVCQKPERLADVICAMRENHIEPKVLRFVSKEAGTEPWLFLLEGQKGAKPNMRVRKPLAVYEKGEYSSEMKEIYGK